MKELKGIIVAMATPFHADESLAPQLIKPLVDKQIADGVHGLFAAGSCGENYALDDGERVELAQATVEAAAGRVPVVIGAGMPTTRDTIKAVKALNNSGADVLSVVLPYYARPTQEEIYRHFMDVAEHSQIPLMIYNIPPFTGTNLEPQTAAKLSRTGKFVAVKDSSGDFAQFEAYAQSCDPSMALIIGNDQLMYKAFEIGAAGAITAPGNALSRICVAIYERSQAGDKQGAAQAQADWDAALEIIGPLSTTPGQYKAVTSRLVSEVGPPRRPAYPADPKKLEDVIAKLTPFIEKYY